MTDPNPAVSPSKDLTPKPSTGKPLIDTGSGYQQRDQDIVDYQLWKLSTPQMDFLLRGQRPQRLEQGQYIAHLGAAFTFGRFVPQPYPALLSAALNLDALNLGFAGIGPAFFNDPRHSGLIDWINRAKFATILVFSGRSQATSRFPTAPYSQEQYILENGKVVPADFAYQQLLNHESPETLALLVEETRSRYLEEFSRLLDQITVPKVLVWFAKRKPDYQESYQSLFKLFSNFPHLVNRPMMDQLSAQCDVYVEYSGTVGMPQPLISRWTGEATTITRPRDYQQGKIQLANSTLTHNGYYPSPEMHQAVTQLLIPKCQAFL